MKAKVHRWFRDFWEEEDGQATVEYTLVLSIMISLAVIVVRTFIAPLYTRMLSMISKKIENEVFGADLHTFRVRR